MPPLFRSILSIRRTLLFAVVVGGLACGAEPTGPSVSDVRIDPSSARLLIGNTLALEATVRDSDGAGSVTWTTSDPSVATVSDEGVVEAVGAGTAQVEAAVMGVSASARIDVPEPAGTLDSGGGLLEAGDGVVEMDVPRGALGQETAISVETASSDSLPATTGGARRIPGTAFEFGPRDIAFGSPAQMSIRYDPARIPRDVEEENLRLHRARNGGWELVAPGTVDMEEDVVRGMIDGFSVYAVVDVPHGVPTAEITSPVDGAAFPEGTVVSFQGSASDPADGDLTGESLIWASSEDGPLGKGTAHIDDSLSVGSHEITLTATDSDGVAGSASVSITIVPSNEGPSLEITQPADDAVFDEGEPIPFTGSASDEEDGDLSSEITWTSDRDGELGTGASLERTLSSGRSHRVTASVTDSDGVTATESVLVTVDAAPTVSITGPADGSTFEEGVPIPFEATASDPEEGNLASSIEWSSDLDGEVGSGASVSASTLSVGQHTVTATVTDGRDQSASDQITVTVDPNTAAGLAFTTGPSSAASGAAIDPPVVVEVQDENGEPVTLDPDTSVTESVTVAFASGTNEEGATLSGTVSQEVDWESATATFDDLSIDLAGSYALSATPSGSGFSPG
ncbi:MAG: Ig-like domain-containing protein, partial [Gemmatimonadota bacterium]